MSTLARIEDKFRKLASVPLETHITQAGVREYIDDAYIYDMPAQVRIWPLIQNVIINLQPTYPTYTFDVNKYLAIEPPVYVAGYPMTLFQSQDEFWAWWGKEKQLSEPTTGNGGAVYSFTLSQGPILRGSLFIAGNSGVTQLEVTDDGDGNLIGDVGVGTNTIDYETGQVTVTFSSIITSGQQIYANYESRQDGTPVGVLFFNSELTVRPVPDKAYQMEIQALVRPTSMVNDNDSPQLKDWWQYIAWTAAQKYLEDQNRTEEAMSMESFIRRERQKVLSRQTYQLASQRSNTIYAPGLTRSPSYNGNPNGYIY